MRVERLDGTCFEREFAQDHQHGGRDRLEFSVREWLVGAGVIPSLATPLTWSGAVVFVDRLKAEDAVLTHRARAGGNNTRCAEYGDRSYGRSRGVATAWPLA